MEMLNECISNRNLTMKRSALLLAILLLVTIALIIAFQYASGNTNYFSERVEPSETNKQESPEDIKSIPLPAGFKRIPGDSASFGDFLRNVHLRKNNTVYLYNGQPIQRQDLHYAVLDLSTGNKDLQQCADAIMRLRAEYFFASKRYSKISFPGSNGNSFNFENYARLHNQCYSHDCLLRFMEKVYTYCGTYTVEAMTKPAAIKDMRPGDVFVKAGAPGHAMIVADMAVNEKTGEKIYLLAQGYVPAQDMHIVINPGNTAMSPWYELNYDEQIITPGWLFNRNQLRHY